MDEALVLSVRDLHLRHRAVTPGIAAYFAEAVQVCLDRHHCSPAVFEIDDDVVRVTMIVKWTTATQRLRDAWDNEPEATEAAACGLALLAVEQRLGLVAVRRAKIGSGADYYLGQPGSDPQDLERLVRLEVSGVDLGGMTELKSRLRVKALQAARGVGNLPALASVVGLNALTIVTQDVT